MGYGDRVCLPYYIIVGSGMGWVERGRWSWIR